MEQIVVFKIGGVYSPVENFLNVLEDASAGQVVTQEAVVVAVSDPEMTRLIERVLTVNKRSWYRVPIDESVEDPEKQELPTGSEASRSIGDVIFSQIHDEYVNLGIPPAEEGIVFDKLSLADLPLDMLSTRDSSATIQDEEPAEPVNAQQDHATVAIESDPLCPECRLPFRPSRKGQIYCKDPKCVKARASRYVRESQARKAKAFQENDPEPEPGAALKTGGEEKPDQVDLADALETSLTFAPAYERDLVWYFEDGSRQNTYMTNADLRRLLAAGNLKTGQHLRHRTNGRHEVVKVTNSPAQKLKCLYGEKAGTFVLASEL